METLEAFALYVPTGLYVILIELLVLGMALGILPSCASSDGASCGRRDLSSWASLRSDPSSR